MNFLCQTTLDIETDNAHKNIYIKNLNDFIDCLFIYFCFFVY